jgi:hypothetical protein
MLHCFVYNSYSLQSEPLYVGPFQSCQYIYVIGLQYHGEGETKQLKHIPLQVGQVSDKPESSLVLDTILT